VLGRILHSGQPALRGVVLEPRGKDKGDRVFSRSSPIISFTTAGERQTQCIVPVETNDKLANDMGIPKGTTEVVERLSSTRPPSVADLKVVQFSFKALDGAVSHFQIFVESITFCNQL